MSESESQAVAARIHVLVVEDAVLLRALLADHFRDAGLTVVEAGNADEALAYLNSGGPIDLVLSDIEMPGAMNGLDLAREIGHRRAAVPVILTSGRAWPGIASVGAFIPKPYDVARVLAIVLATLGMHRPDS